MRNYPKNMSNFSLEYGTVTESAPQRGPSPKPTARAKKIKQTHR